MAFQYFNEPNLLTPPVARAAYSDRTCWIMAQCAKAAYEKFENDPSLLSSALTPAGFNVIKTFNKDGTQAFLAARKDFAVLAFRGTEGDIRDILADLKFSRVNTNMGEVHDGFYEAYKLIEDEVLLEVNKLTLPIYITGHSLGGALATIATFRLDRDTLSACYTFGSPRVGDEHLDSIIKAPIYRVVNASDAVTRVPFNIMKFSHVGSLYYLNNSGELKRSPETLETVTSFFKTLLSKFIDVGTDHFIDKYISKLQQIAILRMRN